MGLELVFLHGNKQWLFREGWCCHVASDTSEWLFVLQMGDEANAEGVCGDVAADRNREAAGADHSARLQPRLDVSRHSQRHYKWSPR